MQKQDLTSLLLLRILACQYRLSRPFKQITAALMEISVFILTKQMHACRCFNKETTIRFHNACISVHNAGNAQNFAVGLETTRKHVQLRKWPSSPTRTDEIEARLHQTSCPLTRPGLQRLGQTHQESTSPPMAADERQAWHPLDSSHSQLVASFLFRASDQSCRDFGWFDMRL